MEVGHNLKKHKPFSNIVSQIIEKHNKKSLLFIKCVGSDPTHCKGWYPNFFVGIYLTSPLKQDVTQGHFFTWGVHTHAY